MTLTGGQFTMITPFGEIKVRADKVSQIVFAGKGQEAATMRVEKAAVAAGRWNLVFDHLPPVEGKIVIDSPGGWKLRLTSGGKSVTAEKEMVFEAGQPLGGPGKTVIDALDEGVVRFRVGALSLEAKEIVIEKPGPAEAKPAAPKAT